MLLADELIDRGVSIDIERVLRMALLHDWAETRVGDMPRTASEYFGVENRRRAEVAAFADIVNTTNGSEFYRRLHRDYEERESVEARLVKASDVIDLLVQVLAFERAGVKGLDEFWQATESDYGLEGDAAEIVDKMFKSLLSERERIVER